jgi:hypothetical protein
MAAVSRYERTPADLAASRVMDAELDRVIAGEDSRFGTRVAYMSTDLATAARIRERHDEGYTVVVVDEHENVRVLPVP